MVGKLIEGAIKDLCEEHDIPVHIPKSRDKVARLQTLRQYEDARPPADRRTIVAVIDGRGFGHRLADLNRMMQACDGHVYTLAQLPDLVQTDGPLHKYVGTAKPGNR